MTILWIGLVVVAVVAVLATFLWPATPKRKDHRAEVKPLFPYGTATPGESSGTNSTSGFVAPSSSSAAPVRATSPNTESGPVPIERARRMTPDQSVLDGKPKAVRARKPRATSQTVLEVVKSFESPATAKEISEQLRETTPAKVSAILVGLRRDKKVTSTTRRNLKLWSAA